MPSRQTLGRCQRASRILISGNAVCRMAGYCLGKCLFNDTCAGCMKCLLDCGWKTAFCAAPCLCCCFADLYTEVSVDGKVTIYRQRCAWRPTLTVSNTLF